MAITLATATKQAGVAAMVALADGGVLRIRSSTTTRVDIDLAPTAFDITDGVATARGGDGTDPIGAENPLEGESDTVGAWDNYQVLATGGSTVLWSGTSADLSLSIVGDTVQVTSWTFTIPDPA